MNSRNFTYLIIILTILGYGCKKPYAPQIAAVNSSYLVVEGVINSGQDSTFIKLSHTVTISGKVTGTAELGARLSVESDQGAVYPLVELGKGIYASVPLNLDNNHKYHLHIITLAGKEYVSDAAAIKPTPPIDSVGYTVQNNGIQLYANTHDANNNTRYYRWDYTETWNFHAKYLTAFITDGTQLNYRTPDQQIYTCFASDTSSAILLGSTSALAKDEIYQAPLTQVISTSEKIETKYSILVKEYALTKEAYNFWQNMKKNTEQLGSIFDAQPSEVPGNIRCLTNPAEPVIGYVSITNVQQKRIFINQEELPQSFQYTYPYQCGLDTMLYRTRGGQDNVAAYLLPLNTRVFAIYTISANNKLLGYLSTTAECADCTIRGTTKRPLFWK
jgi:hypothetical protein